MTIATIIGVAVLLALSLGATPAYGDYSVWGHWNPKPHCDCPIGASCSCGMVMATIEPCTWEELLSKMRDMDAYYGEDDDDIYFTASLVDPITNQLETDPDGTSFIVMDKSFLQDWVNAGCPGQE